MKKFFTILLTCFALTSCLSTPHSLTSGVSALATAQAQQTEIVADATTAQDKAEDTQTQAETLAKTLDTAAPEVKAQAVKLAETATAAAESAKIVTNKLAEQTKTLETAQAQATVVTDEKNKALATVEKDKVKIIRRNGWIAGLAIALFFVIAAIVGYIVLRFVLKKVV